MRCGGRIGGLPRDMRPRCVEDRVRQHLLVIYEENSNVSVLQFLEEDRVGQQTACQVSRVYDLSDGSQTFPVDIPCE